MKNSKCERGIVGLLEDVFGYDDSKITIADSGLSLGVVLFAIGTIPAKRRVVQSKIPVGEALRCYYGFPPYAQEQPKTLRQVGAIFGVSPERARQRVGQGLRCLRHPSRVELLRALLVRE